MKKMNELEKINFIVKNYERIREYSDTIYPYTPATRKQVVVALIGAINNENPVAQVYDCFSNYENTVDMVAVLCETETAREVLRKILTLKGDNMTIKNEYKFLKRLQKIAAHNRRVEKRTMLKFGYNPHYKDYTMDQFKSTVPDIFVSEFVMACEYTQFNKKKQSKKYTISRDMDRDVYYISSTGRLAKIKKSLFLKYVKENKIDQCIMKAKEVIAEGQFVKACKFINKYFPKMNECAKQYLCRYFEGTKPLKMVIDTDFKKAYDPCYNTHQDTDGDKASNYSCMREEGDLAQDFYGKIHGCKVVRWELDNGEQIGRCIVYENDEGKRHFIRIYGQYEYHRTMIAMLEAEMKDGDLFGRREEMKMCLSTDFDEYTKAMYLDGNNYGIREVDGEYFVSNRYDNGCKETDFCYLKDLVGGYVCEHCGAHVSEDDAIYIDGNDYCCTDCASEDGWTQCDHCGEWVRNDESIWVHDEVFCSTDCAEVEGYRQCTHCGEWKKEGEMEEIDGDYYCCADCAADAGYSYDDYNRAYTKDKCLEYNGYWCTEESVEYMLKEQGKEYESIEAGVGEWVVVEKEQETEKTEENNQ